MNDILNFDDRPADVAGFDLGELQRASASPTVLDVDRWGQRRAEDIAERWNEQGVLECDQAVIADAHDALFSPDPQPSARPVDASRAAWWKQMMETPEYAALHNQTMLNADISEIAAAEVCRQWVTYQAEQPEPQEGDPEPGSDGEPIKDTVGRMRSVAKAMQAATKEADAAQCTAAGLGSGDGTQLDPATFREYFKRVRDDSTLRAIMQMAGRMRSLCRALQRAKVTHGMDDTVGVELGGDVARLVPSEMLALDCGIEELETLALHRVATRRALCREYRGIEPVGRGPIVVSVDESGSMAGDKIVAAKGLAIALAWLAHHQRRHIVLAGFSGTAECTRYVAPPRHSDPAKLLEWCAHFYNGGTVLDGPLSTVPLLWGNMPKGKTDHIIITDGIVACPDALRDGYKAFADANQVKTYGIMIGSNNAGGLKDVADRVWCVPTLALETMAVQEVLSL